MGAAQSALLLVGTGWRVYLVRPVSRAAELMGHLPGASGPTVSDISRPRRLLSRAVRRSHPVRIRREIGRTGARGIGPDRSVLSGQARRGSARATGPSVEKRLTRVAELATCLRLASPRLLGDSGDGGAIP